MASQPCFLILSKASLLEFKFEKQFALRVLIDVLQLSCHEKNYAYCEGKALIIFDKVEDEEWRCKENPSKEAVIFDGPVKYDGPQREMLL